MQYKFILNFEQNFSLKFGKDLFFVFERANNRIGAHVIG